MMMVLSLTPITHIYKGIKAKPSIIAVEVVSVVVVAVVVDVVVVAVVVVAVAVVVALLIMGRKQHIPVARGVGG